MIMIDFVDLIFKEHKFLKFLFKIFQLWVLGIEFLQAIINFVSPEPVVLIEGVEELLDVVLGALDGTSEQEDDLNDFLVLSDPVIEWFSLVFREILLVPVLHVFG